VIPDTLDQTVDSTVSTRPTIYFRGRGRITDLFLNKDDVIAFDYGGPQNIIVSFRRTTADESASEDVLNAEYELTFEQPASATIRAMFEALLRGEMPIGSLPSTTVIKNSNGTSQSFLNVSDDGVIKSGVAPMELLPQAFRDFIELAYREPRRCLKHTTTALRWRVNARGDPNPWVGGSAMWSLDKTEWRPLPTSWRFEFSGGSALRIGPKTNAEIEAFVRAGSGEPVSHELFREAWAQRNENPRSALVIGIAACEVAIKLCVSQIVPDAQWLVENLPSPPIVKLLTEYFPKLPIPKLNGKVVTPEIVADLKKGVLLRNQIAHTGEAVSQDTCREILESVRDVLWLCDYYSGHGWALYYVSDETRAGLGLTGEDDS
jgi:hypothetical protein